MIRGGRRAHLPSCAASAKSPPMLTINDLSLRVAGRLLLDHASLFLPEGSTRSVTGVAKDQIKYLTPDGKTSFLIGLTDIDNAPLDNFERLAADIGTSRSNYQQRQLRTYASPPVGTTDAAVWEFTWDGDPIGGDDTKRIPSHAINLGVVADGKDYALYATSPEEDWATSQKRFDVMVDSFRVE